MEHEWVNKILKLFFDMSDDSIPSLDDRRVLNMQRSSQGPSIFTPNLVVMLSFDLDTVIFDPCDLTSLFVRFNPQPRVPCFLGPYMRTAAGTPLWELITDEVQSSFSRLTYRHVVDNTYVGRS